MNDEKNTTMSANEKQSRVEHRHSGLAFFTPSAVHHGQVEPLAAIRNDALARAYALHPERFVHGPPVTHLPPDAVYINPPAPEPRFTKLIVAVSQNR